MMTSGAFLILSPSKGVQGCSPASPALPKGLLNRIFDLSTHLMLGTAPKTLSQKNQRPSQRGARGTRSRPPNQVIKLQN
ncbi:hypothetical protein [Blackfly microvirus SF02]|uniref:Uncharacterized protein n=1 Tax=Blackfly microvirus SF02 TaxID=2576452 RepID=A0A4P8PLR5_9VIRU|nr:hypothetical protein [Blackfly microvirus SF02]